MINCRPDGVFQILVGQWGRWRGGGHNLSLPHPLLGAGLTNQPMTTKATTSIGDALHSLGLSKWWSTASHTENRGTKGFWKFTQKIGKIWNCSHRGISWSVSNFGGAVGTLVGHFYSNFDFYCQQNCLPNWWWFFEFWHGVRKAGEQKRSNMIVNIFYMFASTESTSQIMHQSAWK